MDRVIIFAADLIAYVLIAFVGVFLLDATFIGGEYFILFF